MDANELRRSIKATLAAHDLTLAELVRATGRTYSRTHRIVGGYLRPRPGELESLFADLERLAARQVERERGF